MNWVVFFTIPTASFIGPIFVDRVVTLPLCIWGVVHESLCIKSETISSGGLSISARATVLLSFIFSFRIHLNYGRVCTGLVRGQALWECRMVHVRGVHQPFCHLCGSAFRRGTSTVFVWRVPSRVSRFRRKVSFAIVNRFRAELLWDVRALCGTVVCSWAKAPLGFVIDRRDWGWREKRLWRLLWLVGVWILFMLYLHGHR